MADNGTFSDAVRLYRLAGYPPLDDGIFSGEVGYAESRELLARMQDPRGYGRFDDLLIDGEDFSFTSDLPETGHKVEFKFVCGTYPGRFYASVDELRKSRHAARGGLPERFYLRTDDYLHGEDAHKPMEVRILEDWARFVASLRELAEDSREDSGLELLFVDGGRLGALKIELTPDILSFPPPAGMRGLMDDLLSDESWLDDGRRGRFEAAMCDALAWATDFRDFYERMDEVVRSCAESPRLGIGTIRATIRTLGRRLAIPPRASRFVDRWHPPAWAIIGGGAGALLGLDASAAPAEMLGAAAAFGAVASGFTGASLSILTALGGKVMRDIRATRYIAVLRLRMGWALFGGFSLSITSIAGLWFAAGRGWVTALWTANLALCVACLWRLAKAQLRLFSDPDNIPKGLG